MNNDGSESPQQKSTRLAIHVDNLYSAMYDQSQEDSSGRFYVGNITELFKSVGVPMGQYSFVKRALFGSGCLVLIRRGSRAEPSLVQICRPPTERDLTLATDTGKLSTSVREADLVERLHRLEVWRETFGVMNVIEVLANFEKRISRLEAKGESLSG